MEQMDPLAQLKDIHLPQAPGLWPLAWGWWVLFIVILLVLVSAIMLWRRHRARNLYRAEAIAELELAKQAFDQDRDVAGYLQQLSIILRRAALTGCGDAYHANLKSEAWLEWLDNQCPETQKKFATGPGRVLLTGPYQKAPAADVDSLHKLARQWLQQHRNQWQKNRATQTKLAKKPQIKNTHNPEATTDA